MITTNVLLFLCHTSIDWTLILIVHTYNFKEFTGETAISYFGIVIHSKRFIAMSLSNVMPCYVHIATSLSSQWMSLVMSLPIVMP